MPTAEPGLCASCANVKRVESARGSVFYRCMLADRDARFAKYPNLPVLNCAGYERATKSIA
jgi:hypothetical protein